MRRLIYLQLFLLCSFVALGQRNSEAIRRTFLNASSSTVLVAAHRAAHLEHPENSLDAIRKAIELGVDIIEIDVKVSKDGVPFLMHDRTMNRTTTGKGDPEEFTWEELQQFYIVDKGAKTSLKIPKLEDALELADGKIMVDLDLKTDRIEQIIEVIKNTDTKEIVFFFDSDYNVLSRVQKLDKELMIMPRAYSTSMADSAIVLFDPPVVHIDFSFYTPECAQVIKRSSARIWINALGECDAEIRSGKTKRALKKLLSEGANVVQTDEPELLLKALERHGYRPGASASTWETQ